MYLVTGSTGFVGRATVLELKSRGHKVREVSRNLPELNCSNIAHVPSIDRNTDWKLALDGVDVVIHCAARAHRMNDPKDCLNEYKRVNTDGTLKLAHSCLKYGVRRLVYVSTIKVCSDNTPPGEILVPNSPRAPSDWYSQTKADAEVGLEKLAQKTALELVIVRPPLVYGPGAKGNLERLVKLSSKHIPLPLGAINNRRSLVGLENLTDFLIYVSNHPLADGQIFNISDGKVVSTTQILQILSRVQEKNALLFPVSPALLIFFAKLTGTSSYVNRLISNLEVDSTNCFELLNWKPPRSVNESIESLVK